MKNGMQDRIDTILSSLDHTKRASAPDYLYTRIKGRLQNGEESSFTFWLLRPVPLITILMAFLFINAGLVWKQESEGVAVAVTSNNSATPDVMASPEASASPETEVPYAVAAEYRLHDNITFYDNGREISSR